MGKQYRCIGLQEDREAAWSGYFTKGKVYGEVSMVKRPAEGSLRLIGRSGAWYVDADQFEEVVHTEAIISEPVALLILKFIFIAVVAFILAKLVIYGVTNL